MLTTLKLVPNVFSWPVTPNYYVSARSEHYSSTFEKTLCVTLTLVLKKKVEKPTIFEVLQGVLNDTGEVQKKIFFG